MLFVTLVDCDGVIYGLGVTSWMVCLCKLCLSDIAKLCMVAIVTYFNVDIEVDIIYIYIYIKGLFRN